MMIDEVCIHLDSVADTDDVAAALSALTADGPFVVAHVEQRGDRHRCVFDLKRPDLVVGYRSVIDLQLRIDREFHIVSVASHPLTHESLTDRNPQWQPPLLAAR
jgi:hypothetical protein